MSRAGIVALSFVAALAVSSGALAQGGGAGGGGGGGGAGLFFFFFFFRGAAVQQVERAAQPEPRATRAAREAVRVAPALRNPPVAPAKAVRFAIALLDPPATPARTASIPQGRELAGQHSQHSSGTTAPPDSDKRVRKGYAHSTGGARAGDSLVLCRGAPALPMLPDLPGRATAPIRAKRAQCLWRGSRCEDGVTGQGAAGSVGAITSAASGANGASANDSDDARIRAGSTVRMPLPDRPRCRWRARPMRRTIQATRCRSP